MIIVLNSGCRAGNCYVLARRTMGARNNDTKRGLTLHTACAISEEFCSINNAVAFQGKTAQRRAQGLPLTLEQIPVLK